MFEEDFYDRLIQLRMEKGVSARDMSLSLGQSETYINRIENRRMLPSMTVFFYICEYLGITPGEFFMTDPVPSKRSLDALKKLQTLDPTKYEHILAVIEDL
ncbi:MAG TPA: XRE family transcriptional regulator [Lachnospiraceae bacterium]|nr:XRE family transcriptional regulator [Lachnospiraceae bacterium]